MRAAPKAEGTEVCKSWKYATCSLSQVGTKSLNGLLGFPQFKLQNWTRGKWVTHKQASNQEKGTKKQNKRGGKEQRMAMKKQKKKTKEKWQLL